MINVFSWISVKTETTHRHCKLLKGDIFRFLTEARDLSLVQSLQIGSKAHKSFYTMSIGDLCTEVMQTVSATFTYCQGVSVLYCGNCIECIVVILCVIVVLCVYCCFYFRCRTAV
jgi:hypothetical protein